MNRLYLALVWTLMLAAVAGMLLLWFATPRYTDTETAPGADQGAHSVVTSARDPLNGRESPRQRSARAGTSVSGVGPETAGAVSLRIAGTATWYCATSSACTRGYRPSDLVAAIDTDLGFAKGDRIRVSAFGKSVVVTIVDLCGCPGTRLVDLTRGAFARLANPDLGVIPVTLELVTAEPTGPPTDVAP